MYKLFVLFVVLWFSSSLLQAQESKPRSLSIDTIKYHADTINNNNVILINDTIIKKHVRITVHINYNDSSKESHQEMVLSQDTVIKKRVVKTTIPKPFKQIVKSDSSHKISMVKDTIIIKKPIVIDSNKITRPQVDSCSFVDKNTIIVPSDSVKTFRETWFYNYFLKYDSTANPRFSIRPFFENGIFFFRSDSLKRAYGTQSFFFGSFGIQIGHPKTARIIPYAQLTFSNFKTNKVYYTNSKVDSGFKMKQIIIGVLLPFHKKNDTFYRLKLAYDITIIKETAFKMDDSQIGMQVGIGIDRRFIGNTRLYADFSYIYQKSSYIKYRDFDLTRLAIGLVL